MTAKFIPLRLIGVGTPEIESAASFMFRLASAHGLNVARMNDVLLAHLMSDRNFSLFHPIRTGGKAGLSTYCRPVASSAQFRFAVKQYIGEDNIDKACVLPVCTGMPTESWSLIDGPIRWCPKCLSDDVSGGVEPYLRLIWQFSLVKICVHHWVKLERECPCCGFEQNSVFRNYSLLECCNCNASLCSSYTKCSDADLVTGLWDLHDLVELISSGYRFSWDRIFSSLLLVMEREFGGIQGVREWEERRDLTTRFSPFLEGKKGIPGLYRILQFCQAAQVPLRGVLTGQPYPAPRALPLGTGFESKSVCLISRRNKALDHRSIRSQVVKLMEDHDPPLSLKKIAQRLHVSPGYIEYRWPGLVAANVKRNRRYRDEKKMSDALIAEALVRDYIQSRLDSGLTISVKNTARTLVKESDLSRSTLEVAAKRVIGRMEEHRTSRQNTNCL